MRRVLCFLTVFSGVLFLFVNCKAKESQEQKQPVENTSSQEIITDKTPTTKIAIPLGLDEELNIPANNPITQAKIELGKMLYFDKRLSLDGTVSCATCHDPAKGWSDASEVSTGIKGQKGTRNAPTVVNSTYMLKQFWDGRAKDLEEQAMGPMINPVEMGNPNHDVVVSRIKEIKGYQPYFDKAFNSSPNITNISQAIASFERSILGGNSRYDRYSREGEKVLSASEIKGMELFFGKANCTKCHVGSNFSDSDFHNLGVGWNKTNPDLGRYDATKNPEDKGKFKTPSVRDISRHAPYMHDGSQKTLEEVIEFYNQGGEANPNLDFRMVKINLSSEEKTDLINFLKALDSNPYPLVEMPVLPQ